MTEQSGTFWRRLDWRLWRQSYIQRTPELERLAWVYRLNVSEDVPAKEPRWLAQVLDISLGGIVLSVTQPCESGLLLRVEVQSGQGDRPVLVLARIIQISHRSSGSYLLSCCFARELEDDDLQLFGAQRVRPADQDIRAWVRFPCDRESVFHSMQSAEHERCRARIMNISAGGVGILSPRKIEAGTLLNLELFGADGQSLRVLKARVLHESARGENQWMLGCTFVAELTDKEVETLM